MTDDPRKLERQTDTPVRELTGAELETISGGSASEHTVQAPRDAVSGNATGRRTYKPYV